MVLEPLVSVIIPCYNVSSFVDKAVNSILFQTYTNLEIWLIDDASEDDTLQKIRAVKDDRVYLEIFKNNTQKINAVNEVLKKVKGQLICFQDADDFSELDRIEQQVKLFNDSDQLGICFTNYRYENNKGKLFKIALTDDELKDEFLNFGNKKYKSLSSTICASMMIRKEVLLQIGGYHPFFKGRVGEDIHWIYRILKEFRGASIDKILYHVREREGSLTQIQFSGKNSKSAYSWQLLSKIILKDVKENIDLLSPKNINELKAFELLSCEEVLIEKVVQLRNMQLVYEKSTNYKLGKFVLFPFRLLIFFFSKK